MPIVIRNAGSVLPRGAYVLRPGTVDVAVLAPIPVSGWTGDDLDERIAEVRQRFVDTLVHWPTDRPRRRPRWRGAVSRVPRPPRRFGPGPEARARLRERLPERLRLDLDSDADATARWPADHDGPVVFLVVADGSLEHRLVERWIRRHRPAGTPDGAVTTIAIPDPHGRRREALDARLVAWLAQDPAGTAGHADTLFVPLRVVWLPPERDGERTARLRDVVTLGDPRTPGALRQRLIATRERERARIISGEPATAARLREDFARHSAVEPAGAGTAADLAAFVARRAGLALEQAEWRMLGARYKVPSHVVDDIQSRADFRQGLDELAARLGRPVADLRDEAGEVLEEMAAGHSRYMIDLSADFARWMYTQAYEETIHYDRQRFEEIQVLVQRYPVVFLPSHKSYLDPVVMRWIFHQQGLPPNHTAAGRNMNFWPIGPLYRRAGAFFIRRSFKDDPVYKFVVREYVGYLIEKRFHLEWYLEGGRSRSGKLLAPKLGPVALRRRRLPRGPGRRHRLPARGHRLRPAVGGRQLRGRGARRGQAGGGLPVPRRLPPQPPRPLRLGVRELRRAAVAAGVAGAARRRGRRPGRDGPRAGGRVG